MQDRLIVRNESMEHVTFELGLEIANDFADIMTVKAHDREFGNPDPDPLPPPVSPRYDDEHNQFVLQDPESSARTQLIFSQRGQTSDGGISYRIELGPREQWELQLDVVPMIATEKSVSDALAGVHHGGAKMAEVLKQVAEDVAAAGDVEIQSKKRDEIDLDQLATDSEDAPVIKIVNLILVQAVKEKASDIHIEPFQRTLKLRYRIDGELVAAESPPKALQLAITSRIKILAGLNIAERRIPQDGRFRIKVLAKEVDLRVSILPTAYGEKIVIRILDKSALTGSIDQMGMDEATLAAADRAGAPPAIRFAASSTSTATAAIWWR
jgi:type II secretory ATPase GspE/PulE/Tfp pilus assembly ATPase PilB-like protein